MRRPRVGAPSEGVGGGLSGASAFGAPQRGATARVVLCAASCLGVLGGTAGSAHARSDGRSNAAAAGASVGPRVAFGLAWATPVGERPIIRHQWRELGGATTEPSTQRLFVGTGDGAVSALDARTGEPLWRYETEGPVDARPATAGDGRVWAGDANGVVYSLDSRDGSLRWAYRTDAAILGTPALATGPGGRLMLYVVNELGMLYALDADTGEWLWHYRRELPVGITLKRTGGPVVAGDLVLCGFADGTVAAVARDDGALQWSRGLKVEGARFGDADGRPVADVGRGLVYVTTQARGVTALTLDDGAIRWTRELPGAGGVALVDGGVSLLASVAGGRLVRLTAESGAVEWERSFAPTGGDLGPAAAPIVRGATVVVTFEEGNVVVATTGKGSVLQHLDVRGGLHAGAGVGPGAFYLLTNGGRVLAFESRRQQPALRTRDPHALPVF